MTLRSDLEKLPYSFWENSKIKIRPIASEKDLIYAGFECKLTEEQKELVNPFWFSIGRAYLFREDHLPCIIYNLENEPIGFINFSKWTGSEDAYSWSYFIDKDHQGLGYGKMAAALAIHILKNANPQKQIRLATEVSNLKAQSLYISLGFLKLNETDGDDLVFAL